jgi:hypothetical protein
MPKIPNRFEFEPDSDALKQWLSTRKKKLQVANMSIPGLFTDTRFDVDQSWFLLAMFGELIGIVLTIYGGYASGGMFLLISIVIVFGLLFIDIFCAIKLHRNVGRHCWIDSYIYLNGEEEPEERNRLLFEKEKNKPLNFILIGLIFLVILIKIAAVVLLGVFNNILIYIPILALYLVVGYVHIYHTGYWLAHRKTSKMFRKQFENNGNNAIQKSQPFSTKNKLRNIPIINGEHRIEVDNTVNEKTNTFNYLLTTKGILRDEDIQLLITGQENLQRIEIAEACRKHQFLNYHLSTTNP